MPSIPFDIFFEELFEGQTSPDDAVEISAFSNVMEVKLSLIKFNNEGVLVFSEDEIPAKLYSESRELQDGESKPHYWTNLEFQVEKGCGIDKSFSLALSRWPRFNGWTSTSRFKPYWSGLKDDKPIPSSEVNSSTKLHEWLNSLPHDHWETRKNILTACITKPERLAYEEPKNVRARSETLIGVCSNIDDAINWLDNCETVRTLRTYTEDRSIAFDHVNQQKSKTGKRPELYEDLISDALYLYLPLAIKQALAGDRDMTYWAERPVAELVDRIYREHLNNANKRKSNELKGAYYDSDASDI